MQPSTVTIVMLTMLLLRSPAGQACDPVVTVLRAQACTQSCKRLRGWCCHPHPPLSHMPAVD
jgi:hypothetical protein